MQIVPRAEIGVPDPGTRVKIAPARRYLLGHYPGVNGYNDPVKDWQYARSVAAFGIANGTPFEYSYLVGLGGTIFEQAGDRKPAHCLNFNADAIGILLMAGIGVAPTRAMIDAFRELRAHLVDTGALHPDHDCAPHYKYRSTICPGPMLSSTPGAAWKSPTGEGRLGSLIPDLLEPWAPPITPTPQTPTAPVDPQEAEMVVVFKHPWFRDRFQVTPSVAPLSQQAADALVKAGATVVEEIDDLRIVAYARMCRLPWLTNSDGARVDPDWYADQAAKRA